MCATAALQVVVFLIKWVPMQLLALLKGLLCIMKKREEEHERRVSQAASADSSSEASAGAEARKDALLKRIYASAGLLGVYVVWAIMAWFIFVRSPHSVSAWLRAAAYIF